MRLPVTLKVSDRASGSEVTGRIRRTIFSDVLQWRGWVYAPNAEDRDWDWMAIFAESIQYPRRFECYSPRTTQEAPPVTAGRNASVGSRSVVPRGHARQGVVRGSLIVESDLHCLMRLDVGGRLLRGVRWLIIEYLATNPLDRDKSAGIKYLGESMVAVAAERSLEDNSKGRLWLQSLPRAQEFYENQGFEQLKRRSKEGYKTYILDSNTALQLLTAVKKRRGWKDAEEV